jgi:hypothetical protein
MGAGWLPWLLAALLAGAWLTMPASLHAQSTQAGQRPLRVGLGVTPSTDAPPVTPVALQTSDDDVRPVEPIAAPLGAQEPPVDDLAFGATGGGETFAAASSAVGYIDPAVPMSQIRTRVDSAYDDNRPSRAEYFYMKGAVPKPEQRVDFQEVRSYIEYAPTQRFSGFLEVPVRFLNPQINPNQWGLGDINLGAKYAVIYEPTRVVTSQVTVFAPSGNPLHGLGTGHASVEPALLALQRIGQRLYFEGELKDWIPIGGSDFSGNVLTAGIGTSYQVYQGRLVRVLPVAEFVGWVVLGGKEQVFPGLVQSAAGDTIVNAKFGVRTMLGKPVGNGLLSRADVYAGYGRALTGEVWYKDIMRFELRVRY